MQVMPKTVSTYEFKNHTGEVSDRLKDGPLLLLNRATPQAVLVDPEQWNATAERLSDLEFENHALRARASVDEKDWYTEDEVKAGLKKRGLIGNE